MHAAMRDHAIIQVSLTSTDLALLACLPLPSPFPSPFILLFQS
jgi:hypothetical protein